MALCSTKLLDLDDSADFLELLLVLLGGFLADALEQGGGSVVDQILGFLQAQAGLDFADNLDDVELLGTSVLQNDVELGLLFDFLSSRCNSAASHDGSRRGHAELLFHFLNQVSQLENGHFLDCGDDFCIAHGYFLL